MKLRLRGNSIRLRLGQSEVRRLNAGEALVDTIDFGPASASFSYTLRPIARDIEPFATFNDNRLVVTLSAQHIHRWAITDEVGIHATQSTGDGRELLILIEKDFECIENESGESKEDAFPNPSASCA